MIYKLGILTLVACGHASTATTATHRSALMTTTSTVCAPITAYGAVADDNADDRPAVLAALAASPCVYVPPGRYEIDMAVGVAPARRAYDMITLDSGQTLYGSGADSQLNFRGDAGLIDWRGIHIVGTGITIHDLLITTVEVTNTVEQTHAIHVVGPTAGLSIHDVTIEHPARGHRMGGDCIDFVGYPATMISDTRLDHNHLIACARGGIQIHSGVAGMAITNSDLRAHVIAVDTEGTGSITGLTIAHNTFPADATNGGPFAIALDIVSGAVVSDNVLETQGIYMYSCDHCSIVNNTITRSIGIDVHGVIDAIKGSSELLIAENTVTRTASVDAGPVIHVGPHGTMTPAGVRIVHNTLTQVTGSQVIATEGTVGLLIADNTLAYTGPVPAYKYAYGIIPNGAVGVRTTGIVITRNAFVGAMTAAVALAGSYGGVGSLTMTQNTGNTDMIAGLKCDGIAVGSGITGPIVSVGNTTMPAYKCGTAVIDQ